MRKFLLVMLISMITTPAFSGGWQGYSVVSGYVIEGEDDFRRFYVDMETDPSAPEDGCSNSNSGWKRVYGNTEKGKKIVASILTAYAVKQRVQLLLSGCDDWGRNVVRGIMVHD